MNEEKKFLPFNAINEFMRDDFRLSVIRNVLKNMSELPVADSKRLSKLINTHVKIPGFRNPTNAPTAVKLLPAVKLFEKNPEFVAQIIAAWVELNIHLRDDVYELLKSRDWSFMQEDADFKDILNNWNILPVNADRRKLPGFYPIWPKDENFEILYDGFIQLYPDSEQSIDNVSLMAVWLTMRLPYQVEGETKLEQENLE